MTNFNPRTPCGVRPLFNLSASPRCVNFNPRTPCGVRRACWQPCIWRKHHFNPRTPCGVRQPDVIDIGLYTQFQSTHPMRGATATAQAMPSFPTIFQSTHPMRGATPKRHGSTGRTDISIHAPHAGCDGKRAAKSTPAEQFQSTHPMRGATNANGSHPLLNFYFNPRTPCGVRRHCSVDRRAGAGNFNPRTPCGVRRMSGGAAWLYPPISIHAPHAGCDAPLLDDWITGFTISIHAPHAGCDIFFYHHKQQSQAFQSTHPMRGATHGICDLH